MATNHTPIATGAAGDSAVVNAPLLELDAAIGDLATINASAPPASVAAAIGDLSTVGVTGGTKSSVQAVLGSTLLRTPVTSRVLPAINSVFDLVVTAQASAAAAQAEIDTASAPYADLNERLDALAFGYVGGNIATLTNGTADAGQKDVTVDSTVGFIVGGHVAYQLVDGTLEYNLIASITPTTTLTMTTNIGTGGIGNDVYIGLISISEYLAANAIPHAGSLTLPQTVEYINGGVFNVKAKGASPGASAAVNDAAIRAAVADASAAGGGKVTIPPGRYAISTSLEIMASNVTLEGAGIDVTILDASGTANPARVNYTENFWGIITVDSAAWGSSVSNVWLQDFTLECSPSMNSEEMKAIFFGRIVHAGCYRVKVIGGYRECIYCGGNASIEGEYPDDWRVIDCVITQHKFSAINYNSAWGTCKIMNNYVHDGINDTSVMFKHSMGIAGSGGCIVSGNIVRDVNSVGIGWLAEMPTQIGTRQVTITNNTIQNIGSLGGTNENYGISVLLQKDTSGGAAVVANNIIENMRQPTDAASRAIEVSGPVLVTGNIIRVGDGDTSAWKMGISVRPPRDYVPLGALAPQNPVTVIQGNVIEGQSDSTKRLHTGIIIGNGFADDDSIRCVVSNNTIAADAISEDRYALYDKRGMSDVFNNAFGYGFIHHRNWSAPISPNMNMWFSRREGITRWRFSEVMSSGSWYQGDIIENYAPTVNSALSWVCIADGTYGTLNGGATTGTIKTGAAALIPSAITGLYLGAIVAIVGVSGVFRILTAPDELVSTTVDATSAAGQKVLNVTSTLNAQRGKAIVIAQGTVREEVCVIQSWVDNVSLTMDSVLAYEHTVVQADTVKGAVILSGNADATVTSSAVAYSAPVWREVNPA